MSDIHDIMELFRGATKAFGTYELKGNPKTGVKHVGQAITKRGDVNEDLWTKHLQGKGAGLGVVPINEDNEAHFGCIDIDDYDGLDHRAMAIKLHKDGLPFVVCRSKSGGAHIFLFSKEFVPADYFIKSLRSHAAKMGFAGREIFPKQSKVVWEKGDIGNWLNMPFFGVLDKGTNRYGFDEEGTPIKTIKEFITFVETKKVDLDFFEGNSDKKEDKKKGPCWDGPPCLETLLGDGMAEGGRNNTLFQYGVYARKKWPDKWVPKVEDANRKFFDEALNAHEVIAITKSLEKKSYEYRCHEEPMCSFCDRATCASRKYGIDSSSPYIMSGSLRKVLTDPPTWFLDIEGQALLLTTEQLYNQTAFQKKCMEVLTELPPTMKKPMWDRTVQGWLKDANKIPVQEDAGTKGQFLDLLETFCAGRTQTLNRDELLLGKPWYCEETNRIYFRLKEFDQFLRRNHFREYQRNVYTSIIKSIGGGSQKFTIKKRSCNTWYIPYVPEIQEALELPDLGENEAAI